MRLRDFRILVLGTAVSSLGNGIWTVVLAWQVYELSNAPAALAVVGLAATIPTVVLALAGGVAGDRFDRRLVLAVAEAVRGLAVGALGVLALVGSLRLWHVVALVCLNGIAAAFRV